MSNDRLEQAVALLRDVLSTLDFILDEKDKQPDGSYEGLDSPVLDALQSRVSRFLTAAPAPEPEPDVAALESLVDEMGSKLRSLKNSIAWAFMNKDCRDWLDRYESYRTREAQR